jgi:protein-S-isoprenylcysteine O-methyltransferase Ste14
VRAVEVVVVVVWAAFWTYWLATAFGTKRGRVAWRGELGIRLVLFVLVVVLVRAGVFRRADLSTSPWRAVVGLTLIVAGLGVAVWARVHLGRNWGTPMSRKEDPEMVTSGPYRHVRHPIYSGLLVAGIGTAVALSWVGLVAVALAGVYFVYSAVMEERILVREFPDSYPAYRRTTKMLLPYVF